MECAREWGLSVRTICREGRRLAWGVRGLWDRAFSLMTSPYTFSLPL